MIVEARDVSLSGCSSALQSVAEPHCGSHALQVKLGPVGTAAAEQRLAHGSEACRQVQIFSRQGSQWLTVSEQALIHTWAHSPEHDIQDQAQYKSHTSPYSLPGQQ